jgi:hypothetical protein
MKSDSTDRIIVAVLVALGIALGFVSFGFALAALL